MGIRELHTQFPHRRSIRLKGYDYTQVGAYFVTLCTWQRECLFGDAVAGEMRLSAAGKIVQWEWRHLGQGFANVQLGAFVVMPNHVHGIIFIHGAERAPRHGTAKPHAEPNVGATQAGQTGRISGLAIPSNMGTSGTDGSPRHVSTNVPGMEIPAVDGDSGGPGWVPLHVSTNVPGMEIPAVDGDSGGPGWVPLHVSTNMPDMETPAVDGDSGGPGWATRHGSTNMPDMEIPAVDGDPDGPGGATRHEQNLPICDNHALPDKAIEDIAGSPLRGPGGPPPQSLGAIIGQWKSRVTKRAWKLPGMHGIPIWQRSYYEHIIRDDADLRRIEEYIQNNPLRWAQDQLHPQAPPNPFNQDITYGN